jgi:hypothetical protein
MPGPGRKREVRPTVGWGVGGKRHDDLATKASSLAGKLRGISQRDPRSFCKQIRRRAFPRTRIIGDGLGKNSGLDHIVLMLCSATPNLSAWVPIRP